LKASFLWKDLRFEGISEGGIRTSIVCEKLDLLFDFGAVTHDRIYRRNLLLTHAHLDHSAGLPYYISQRSLQKLPPPKIFLPSSTVELWEKILRSYSDLEGFPYSYELRGLDLGERAEIKPGYHLRPWPSFHRVPSQGYTIYQSKKRILPELEGKPRSEILERKARGEDIQSNLEVPLVSFSGDAKIEYVIENPDVQKSEVLFMECTYYCKKKDKAQAREWGHTHIDEIAENSSFFKNKALVLIHPSKRYSMKDLKVALDSKLPADLKSRTYLFLPET